MGGVSEGEEEEDEENDAQHVGGEDGGPVRVLQGGADGGEAHVVAEGVAEHRTHQVTCNTERPGSITCSQRRYSDSQLLFLPSDQSQSCWPVHDVASKPLQCSLPLVDGAAPPNDPTHTSCSSGQMSLGHI